MGALVQEQSLKEYIFRINKAIDYMRLHLDREVSLEELAEISNFSKFHFHRTFKAITGIPPHEYLGQLRVGRAQFYLRNNSAVSITELAFSLGFSSVASFSKSFKKNNQQSPSQWRQQHLHQNGKIGQLNSKIGPLSNGNDTYFARIELNQEQVPMEQKNAVNIEVKELVDPPVVYVRNHSIHVHDSQGFERMFATLINWAAPRGLVNFPKSKALTVYRSLPDATGRVQADVCLSVPREITGEGVIGKTTIPGGKYVVLHKEGTLDECFAAWDYLYNEWFPTSGYQPDSRGVYLNHLNDAKTHPEGLHIFDMCISVKPL